MDLAPKSPAEQRAQDTGLSCVQNSDFEGVFDITRSNVNLQKGLFVRAKLRAVFYTLIKTSIASTLPLAFHKPPLLFIGKPKNSGSFKVFIALASTVTHRPLLLIYLKALETDKDIRNNGLSAATTKITRCLSYMLFHSSQKCR